MYYRSKVLFLLMEKLINPVVFVSFGYFSIPELPSCKLLGENSIVFYF
jgi:hypothetical protein